ncbi:MAG: HesA/MoeB/ThiF family protein [Oscillospiraceae bacterium]|nr:HesA/MoeB/ThiF family protein [Oscillospiraceae bacterium]
MDKRYSRQIAYKGVGEGGQRKLSAARIAIVGLGALGTVVADRLCRAGIGFLRLIDADEVELSNLQRQMLYTESDVGRSKVEAAALHIREINRATMVEAIPEILTAENSAMLRGLSVVVDCTDNIAARYIINEQCHATGTPWVHGAAAGADGVVFVVKPGGACFRCLYPDVGVGGETADTLGVLGTLTAVVGALQANEALKTLLGEPSSGLLMLDVWNGVYEFIHVEKDPRCPVCGS